MTAMVTASAATVTASVAIDDLMEEEREGMRKTGFLKKLRDDRRWGEKEREGKIK